MTRIKLQKYFLATGFAFLSIFAGLLYRVLVNEEVTHGHETSSVFVRISWFVFKGILLVIMFYLTAMCFHIYYIPASKSHTCSTILLLYIMNQRSYPFIRVFKRGFDDRAKNPRRAQEDLLISRMKRDANTPYGKRYKFSDIKCLEDLRTLHPLTSYDHYEEYIERMADGEKNVLSCEKLYRFGMTSGTTGKGKLIPIPTTRFTNVYPRMHLLSQDACGKKYDYASPLQKTFVLYVNPKPSTTPGGDLIGPMTLFTENWEFYLNLLTNNPWKAWSISTEHEAYYIELLFGLGDPNIGKWIVPYSSQIYKAMLMVEKQWKQFVHDIGTGTIDKELLISSDVREACEKVLTPEPERAGDLRKEFEKGFNGIMRRIWPNLKVIFSTNTADFTDKLNATYAKGLPIVSDTYMSTEGDFGVNLWPDEDKFAFIPDASIFEFIPEDNMKDPEPKTLFLDEVKIGEAYEMLASTICGFYRYRFGDVIQVVDFYYNLPVFKFMYRSGQLLNLKTERVTEVSVDEAVHHMVTNMGANLAHWTAAENVLLDGKNGVEYEEGSLFYLVFVELEEGDNFIQNLTKEHQEKFDQALQERNNIYRISRKIGTICVPRVYLVKPGTFHALQDYIINNSTTSFNQFKLPRKLKTKDLLKLMLDNRV